MSNVMSNEALAQEIALLFKNKGYGWKINGEVRNPLVEDVLELLDKAAASLYSEPDGATLLMTTGRLIIKKDAGHIDVYVYLGEYDDSSDD